MPTYQEQGSHPIDAATQRLIQALFRHSPTVDWTIQQHRDAFDEAARSRTLAPDVRLAAAGLVSPRAEWAIPHDADADATVLYLHGGGFIMGTIATTRPLATHLAASIGARVLYPEYRLAPEHPFPAQLEDAMAAYTWLLDQGVQAENVGIVGDSAGGGLAVSTMIRLRDEGIPLPRACVCISPLFDLALTSPSIDSNAATEPQAPRWLLEQMVRAYTGDADSRDPAISPYYADLHGLPPTLIQVGGLESLRDDSVRFASHAKETGVDVSLRIWPGAIHVWHAFAPRLSLANTAFGEIGRWLRPLLNPRT